MQWEEPLDLTVRPPSSPLPPSSSSGINPSILSSSHGIDTSKRTPCSVIDASIRASSYGIDASTRFSPHVIDASIRTSSYGIAASTPSSASSPGIGLPLCPLPPLCPNTTPMVGGKSEIILRDEMFK